MPTVIAMDTSLSMCRPVQMVDETETFMVHNIAVHGLTALLEHMNKSFQLEFVSLMTFCDNEETTVPFTRDFAVIKRALMSLEYYKRSNILNAIKSIRSSIMKEWGGSTPSQALLITDGLLEQEMASLKKDIEAHYSVSEKGIEDSTFPLPFPFPCKLHIMYIGNSTDPCFQASLPIYQKLVDIAGGKGQVFVPEGALNFKSVIAMFTKLAQEHYSPFHGVLHCGHFTSKVSLFPPPEPYYKVRDFETVKGEFASEIYICGFLSIADVSSPPSYSRHLVLPLPGSLEDPKPMVMDVDKAENEAENEEGKQPSFCVLLHGSLKAESMVAICQLGGNWYGMIYSCADTKEKSNLMLSAFEPGLDVIPWLGDLDKLGPIGKPASSSRNSSFPIIPTEKKSYAQNRAVWINRWSLQHDIQKILRRAEKLPERTHKFYKELNRLRKTAIAVGFNELLESMATMLDRACNLLPESAHPDTASQITHAANALRNDDKNYNTVILPLKT